MERDDNHVLPLDETLGFERGEMLNCISYCAAKGNCEILVLQLFAVHICVDLVLVRPSISPHSQTSSRNFNATVTVKPYFA